MAFPGIAGTVLPPLAADKNLSRTHQSSVLYIGFLSIPVALLFVGFVLPGVHDFAPVSYTHLSFIMIW